MKEVKKHRFAGPFEVPPTKYYVQSPLGLVPKSGGQKTRLIFPCHMTLKINRDQLTITPRTISAQLSTMISSMQSEIV